MIAMVIDYRGQKIECNLSQQMSQVMSLLSSKPCNGSHVTQNEMKANTFSMGCKFDEVYTPHTPTRAPLPH